jgi:hypothetical protein
MKTACRLRLLTTALSTFVLLASVSLLQASDGQFLTAEAALTGTSSTTPATIAARTEATGLVLAAVSGSLTGRAACVAKFARQCRFNECRGFSGEDLQACEEACVDFAEALCPQEPVFE